MRKVKYKLYGFPLLNYKCNVAGQPTTKRTVFCISNVRSRHKNWPTLVAKVSPSIPNHNMERKTHLHKHNVVHWWGKKRKEKKRAQLFLVLFDSQSIRITTARASRSGAQGPDRDWCSEEVNNLRNMDLPCSSKGIAITLQFLEPEGSFSMQQVRSSARVMRVSSERIRHVQLYLFAFWKMSNSKVGNMNTSGFSFIAPFTDITHISETHVCKLLPRSQWIHVVSLNLGCFTI